MTPSIKKFAPLYPVYPLLSVDNQVLFASVPV